MLLGYKTSVEQFEARDILAHAVQAEELGFDFVAVSDHFQPMRHSAGHASFSLACLGAVAARTTRVTIGSSVITPTLRYQPAIIAQAFATLAALAPERVFLGLGSGEAMNEVAATGSAWPTGSERRERLAEAIVLIRGLWAGERVTHAGRWYATDRATIYDRPKSPIPIFVAASGPVAARLAGEFGDGLIATSGKEQALYPRLVAAFEAGARSVDRDPSSLVRLLEVKVSYDRDAAYARAACAWWAGLSLTSAQKVGISDPVELERLAGQVADPAGRFLVASDPAALLAGLEPYIEAGFDRLLFHAPGTDQSRFLEQFAADVLPRLRMQ